MKKIILSAVNILPHIWLWCWLGRQIQIYQDLSNLWLSWAMVMTIILLVILCIATETEILDS